MLAGLNGDYPSQVIGSSLIIQADCFEWLAQVPENTFHAVVTDPPYGLKEYEAEQIAKREIGQGGVWRIPPSVDRK
jgi:site-specific DNA-methyltransferase (adenine-specific)